MYSVTSQLSSIIQCQTQCAKLNTYFAISQYLNLYIFVNFVDRIFKQKLKCSLLHVVYQLVIYVDDVTSGPTAKEGAI